MAGLLYIKILTVKAKEEGVEDCTRDGRREEERKKSEGEGVMERMLSGGTLTTPLLAIGEYEGCVK